MLAAPLLNLWRLLSSAAGCAQMVARSKADILAARGVKPTLSPNLNTLATVEALGVKRLLFIGVGCQARLCPCCVMFLPLTWPMDARRVRLQL